MLRGFRGIGDYSEFLSISFRGPRNFHRSGMYPVFPIVQILDGILRDCGRPSPGHGQHVGKLERNPTRFQCGCMAILEGTQPRAFGLLRRRMVRQSGGPLREGKGRSQFCLSRFQSTRCFRGAQERMHVVRQSPYWVKHRRVLTVSSKEKFQKN